MNFFGVDSEKICRISAKNQQLNELEEKKEDILPIYTIIKEHPDKSKEQIYAILKKES